MYRMFRNVILLILVTGFWACSEEEDHCNPERLQSINIEEITVRSFPNFKPDGEVWDTSFVITEYPADLVVVIYNSDSIIWQSQIYKPNVTSPSETTFTQVVPLMNVDQEVVISVWDMDDIENEFIGSVQFVGREIYSSFACNKEFLLDQNNIIIEVTATFNE